MLYFSNVSAIYLMSIAFYAKQVDSIESFWIWTRENLVPGLYDVKWYNGKPFSYREGFIRNREAFMVGMPRLRQKRFKKGK